MSTRWLSKTHAALPLTEQEERVEQVLLQYRMSHLTHAAFPVANRTYIADFFLSDRRIVLECWQSSSRRGVALCWVERNAAYVDLKFKRIKLAYPEIHALAFVEVVHAQPSLVREYAGPVLEHADMLCCSLEELSAALRGICGIHEGAI